MATAAASCLRLRAAGRGLTRPAPRRARFRRTAVRRAQAAAVSLHAWLPPPAAAAPAIATAVAEAPAPAEAAPLAAAPPAAAPATASAEAPAPAEAAPAEAQRPRRQWRSRLLRPQALVAPAPASPGPEPAIHAPMADCRTNHCDEFLVSTDYDKFGIKQVLSFIGNYQAGRRCEINAPAFVSSDADGSNLLAQLCKEGQRKSHSWKQTWAQYCQHFGGGRNEPEKPAVAFIQGFLDHVAARGILALLASAADFGSAAKRALMPIAHASVASQPTVDGSSKEDWRGRRAATDNSIPSSTCAASAVAKAIPAAAGMLTGAARPEPTIDVSADDATYELEEPTSDEDICAESMLRAHGDANGCQRQCDADCTSTYVDKFGINRAAMTTIHGITASTPTVDGSSKEDWRGSRTVTDNCIPSSTGAARALATVIPADRASTDCDQPGIKSTVMEDFVPISEMSPCTNGRWKVKAHVITKSDIMTHSTAHGEGQMLRIGFEDTSGEMSASFFGKALDLFHPQLRQGQVYRFSGGRIHEASPRWYRSKYVLTFDEHASIEPLGELLPALAQCGRPRQHEGRPAAPTGDG